MTTCDDICGVPDYNSIRRNSLQWSRSQPTHGHLWECLCLGTNMMNREVIGFCSCLSPLHCTGQSRLETSLDLTGKIINVFPINYIFMFILFNILNLFCYIHTHGYICIEIIHNENKNRFN